MTKELSPPAPSPAKPPTSNEIKQLLKRKVQGRQQTAAVPPPAIEIKKEPSRRRPEPAKVPRKSIAARQNAQQQVRTPEPPSTPPHKSKQQFFENQKNISVPAASPRPIVQPEKTPIKSQSIISVQIRSPSIEMVSPVPSSSTTDDVVIQSPPNIPSEFYQYPSQTNFIQGSPANIHPISISYTGNDPVIKNLPNTMILPMEQNFEAAPGSFDEGTRESLYSNEVNEDGEDGVNFLNNMFTGTSNQNSNDYSSTDDDDDGDIQHFDYGEGGGEEFYENSRGVEYTIHEIEETKPARPIILEEKILADNEKFSADWVDKIVKTEVKTEPEGYNFYTQHEERSAPVVPTAHSSRDLQKEIIGEFFLSIGLYSQFLVFF